MWRSSHASRDITAYFLIPEDVGGLAIGMVQAINEGGAYGLGSTWSQTVVFLILIVLMVFKPEGIFGRPTTEKV